MVKVASNNASQDDMLRLSLGQLAAYTERGKQLAWQSIDLLDDIVEQADREVRNAIKWLESNGVEDAQIRAHLTSQLDRISRDFSQLPYRIAEDLDELPGETFTISLFGKTKVGKSTLVSILTKGDGSIIGDGSQQTTREPRTFPWEGLLVIDTPGVSATGEGAEEDARKALTAAAPCDLVIFVVLDDSLQRETAEYLARVRSMGKPVLCLVNIKEGRKIREGHEEEDIADLCDCIDYAFSDEEKLREIREAVLDYDREFSQKWGPMPFVYAHLLSAFLSRQDAYAPWSKQLLEASCFPMAVERISDEINHRGCFMRFRSYVDVVSGPLIDAFEGLSRQSVDSLAQLRMVNNKIHEYECWLEKYIENCELRARTLSTEICDGLKSDADTFAEKHFRDKHANERWDAIVQKTSSEDRANRLLAELQSEATEKLQSLGREMCIELGMMRLKLEQGNVNPQVYVDKKLIWNRVMTATEVALGVAALVTQAPVVATAAAVAGGVHVIGGFLFKDGKHEREDAIREFRRQLGERITAHGNWMQSQIMDVVQKDIVETQLNEFGRTMRSLYGGIASLGTAQLAMATQLNDRIAKLNQDLLHEALEFLRSAHSLRDIVRVARIPGDSIYIVTRAGVMLSAEEQEGISRLLGHVDFTMADEQGSVALSTLVGRIQTDEILVECSSDGHVIAYGPNARGDNLRNIRMCMQLSEIVEFR